MLKFLAVCKVVAVVLLPVTLPVTLPTTLPYTVATFKSLFKFEGSSALVYVNVAPAPSTVSPAKLAAGHFHHQQ